MGPGSISSVVLKRDHDNARDGREEGDEADGGRDKEWMTRDVDDGCGDDVRHAACRAIGVNAAVCLSIVHSAVVAMGVA